jgi:hypothetical protein
MEIVLIIEDDAATLWNKIESRPENPQYLYTVREFGYKFKVLVEA